MGYTLEAREIVKEFGGTRALDRASFAAHPGEVHALIGENGAGKSTLMKILSGALQPDRGSIRIRGRAARVHSPHHALQLGISSVYQQSALVLDLTVAENIFLGRLPKTKRGLVDWKTLYREANVLLEDLQLNLDVRRPVRELDTASRQVTEIARALSVDARVLIMDEPSSVLGPAELEKLFRIIGKLKKAGKSILYVSHRLNEIFRIADRVTVLKDGRNAGSFPLDGRIDRPFLIGKMVGHVPVEKFQQESAGDDELLRVEHLSRQGFFEDICLEIHAGEVVGLAGLLGSGRTDVCKAIFGAAPYDSGRIYVQGKPVEIRSPRQALAHGIAYLSKDRHHEGLIMCLSVGKNITLPILRRFTSRGVLNLAQENRFVDQTIGKMGIRARGRNQAVAQLSGGNQQKVVLAKWLSTRARIFLLDEPTVGVDVGAKSQIYELVASLAGRGAAVLVVSSEIPELLSLCRRIIVMSKRHITGQLLSESSSEQDVLQLAT